MRKFIAADLFAGAGGASSALASVCERAGIPLELTAVNHWERAVETHAANHPKARHHCAAVGDVSPRAAVPGGRLDLLLAGPSCTHHSTARGGKPSDEQSRSSAWDVLRWLTELKVDRVLVENVPEFAKWGPLGHDGRPLESREGETFAAWLAALQSLGYRTDWRVLNAADYGDPTTRRRLFIQGARGRRAILWPEPSHCKGGAADLFGVRPRWLAARTVIDWSLRGTSVFGRKRPLSANTIRRIAAGLARYGGAAFSVGVATSDKPGDPPRSRSIDEPLPTLPGCHSQALVEPFLLGQQSLASPRPVSEPVPTVAGSGAISLIVPTNYGERPGQAPRTHGIDARDRYGLVVPEGWDVLFRMLTPGELARAMSFPAGYVFRGSRAEVVKQIGNAWAGELARALCSPIVAERRAA